MIDYNVEGRLITKADWEKWLNKKDQKETGEEKRKNEQSEEKKE